MPNAELRPIPSIWGHVAGLGVNPPDSEFIDAVLKELLQASWSRHRIAARLRFVSRLMTGYGDERERHFLSMPRENIVIG